MSNPHRKNGVHQPIPLPPLFAVNSGELYLFTSFLDSLPHLCWIVDETERLLIGNIALLNFFGLNTTVLNKPVLEFLPTDIGRLLHQKFQQEWKHAATMKSQLKMTSISGEQHVFDIQSFKLLYNNQTLYGGIAADVSVHHHTEELLFACNEKWLAFTHHAFHGYWEWDLETGQLHCYNLLYDVVGNAPGKTLRPEDWYKAIAPDDRPVILKLVQELLKGKRESWQQEYRFSTLDGATKTFLDRGMVITRNEKPQKLIGFVLDVTDIKETEAQLIQEKKAREQERAQSILQVQENERHFIGQELHDNVAQIITTAKLLVDMIQPMDDNGSELKRKSSKLLQEALDEIRMFSKELAVPVLKAKGLHAAIEDLLADLKLAVPLTIRYSNEMAMSEQLSSSISLTLFRIIQEQVKNILKHAQANAVHISLRRRHGLLELEISDDGIGFNPEKARRGVGLTSIFERTKICGGSLKIKSEPGKGTRLLVVFSV